MENRRFGWLLSALGGFPVTRGTADREALRRCIAVLEAGEPLVLFPEGERKAGPIVQPLFDGAVYVALKAGVPIVPVGIGGSERVMPKGARFIYPRKVHVDRRHADRSPPPADVRPGAARSPIREVHSDELHADAAAAVRRAPSDRRCSTAAGSAPDRSARSRRRGRRRRCAGSAAPHSSRAECIDSCGTPTSTVAMPRRVAVSGPIVEPHGMLLRDTNVCTGTPASSQARRNSAAVVGDRWRSAGWR